MNQTIQEAPPATPIVPTTAAAPPHGVHATPPQHGNLAPASVKKSTSDTTDGGFNGEDCNDEELGGADMHYTQTGLAEYVANCD